ncbi:transmembrane transport protein BCCT family [Neisseria gonorrhoeae]|uniref:Transmembrane transport protein BCCT family n=1 Tax=Neisseria gonorrhoeae TaxID=485 RepID=A0A378VY62_NEIGO|nr:transmembrane transport protein BCCT family [Neisseria gonorrhoeae]
MSQTQEQDILKFLKHTASPAMHELQRELSEEYGLSVRVDKMFHQDEPAIEFVIRKRRCAILCTGLSLSGRMYPTS